MTKNKNIGYYSIDLEIYNYRGKNHRFPTHIILHPEDYTILVNELEHISGHSLINIMEYSGLKIIRTLDIDRGEWYLV